MKKSIIIAAILALALTSGCASKDKADVDGGANPNTNVTDGVPGTSGTADGKEASDPGEVSAGGETENQSADGGQQADVNSYGENASENVDMDAVDGDYLKVSDESEGSSKEQLGVYEVAIKDAKVFDVDGEKYVVFAIDFTNNSSVDMTFASAIKAAAFQDGIQIAPAALPSLPEGIDTATSMQRISNGDKITVQKIFALTDTTTPVELQLSAFHEDTDAIASQIFDIQ